MSAATMSESLPAPLRRDKIIQVCTSPTTDQCVAELKSLLFSECMDVDVKAGYCPEQCKAALAVSPINKDARCLEVVTSYVTQSLLSTEDDL